MALDAFRLDRTEVTNAQYAAFLNAEDNQTEGGVPWLDMDSGVAQIELSGQTYRPSSGYDHHPVVGVSWYGARAYCAWVGGRLPTEAEWEYAASGPVSRTFPWGDDQRPAVANCAESECADGFAGTAPVGSFPEGASWVGALDMAGNVWEWVEDWYQTDTYSSSESNNPVGPPSGDSRVLRGGSWRYGWGDLRVTFRNYDPPAQRRDVIGFRCAGRGPRGGLMRAGNANAREDNHGSCRSDAVCA